MSRLGRPRWIDGTTAILALCALGVGGWFAYDRLIAAPAAAPQSIAVVASEPDSEAGLPTLDVATGGDPALQSALDAMAQKHAVDRIEQAAIDSGAEIDPTVVGSTSVRASTPVPEPASARSYTILQIGDSHTAADIFTGEVRAVLESRFGAGGVFLPPGKPHAGVRSDAFDIKVAGDWTYSSLAKAKDRDGFYLSGYTAKAGSDQSAITFTARDPVAFDAIDVSFVKQPGGGRAEIMLDGEVVDEVALDGTDGEPLIRRLLPTAGVLESFEQIAIRSESGKPVEFGGVLVSQKRSGVSYLNVGFPGARVNILSRLKDQNLADDINRLAPDMIVLAFGTNEGFDDNLDIAKYKATLTDVVASLRAARPSATLVLLGPPASARREDNCAEVIVACTGKYGPAGGCWAQPRHIAQVRQAEREVAKAAGAAFYDWSQALPHVCDIEQGRLGTPALYTKDRVHLTNDGYTRTARAFAEYLIPLVAQGFADR